ncbi:MAG: sugar phosphate isomerase/epimerase [Verrucomicrobia bacterium]|nr:sugar phosphate isomerase/epimerase [Verrucomicrobiota bacterium]
MPAQTRRQFLHTTAALATVAAPALPSRAAAADGIRLGFSLYGMKSLPLADALQTCAGFGYENVELSLGAGYPTEPKLLSAADRQQVRTLLLRNRLTVSALMDNLSLAADDAAHAKNLERIKVAAQLAHDLAPKNPPILETVLGGKPAEWDGLKDKMAERARDWAREASAAKLTLCLKPHVNSAVNSPERLLWLHQQAASPFVKLCYDFSHFQLMGLSLEETLRPLIAETRFIHVKDTAGDAKKVQFLLPGEGHTDYKQYAALLRELGWSGPLVVEVSAQIFNKPGYDPVVAARSSYAVLGAAFGRKRLLGR